MKTSRRGLTTWLASALVLALTGGCGVRSASSGDSELAQAALLAEGQAPTVAGGSNAASGGANAAEAVETLADAEVDPNAPPPVQRSERVLLPMKPEIAEVVRLMDSGAGEEVIRAFVAGSAVPYDLTLDEILYLRDIGVSDSVVAAMMRRGAELREEAADREELAANFGNAVTELKEAFNGAAAALNTNGASGQPAEMAVATPAPAASSALPPEAPEEVQQFYTDLAPYGSWYQTPSYGWVWQPSVVVVNSSWAPYCHGGRWLWTDHGWYWCSDYSWGWAPFHYGRWTTYPGLGWCWVPGRVWGPSWVTWRYTDGYVGWAPLPPRAGWSAGVGLTWHDSGVSVGFGFGLSYSAFTYVPYHSFCYRNVHRHRVHHDHAKEIHKNTTVVNNIINGDNNVIINNGPGYETIAKRYRGEVPKARVATLPHESTQPLRADRLERSKEGMVVYKPRREEAGPGKAPVIQHKVGQPQRGSPIAVASRANASPRNGFVTTPSAAQGPGRSISRQPSSVAARPAPSAQRGVTTSRDNWSPVVAPSKAAESRGSYTTTLPEANQGRGSILAPQRQTTAVPLADPSRNLPAGARVAPSRGTPQTTPQANPISPDKSGFERRATPIETPAPSSYLPSASPNPYLPRSYAPRTQVAPQAGPTPPKPTYERSGTPAVTAPGVRSYTAPSAPSQSFTAPRPSVSAPAPSYSAPRPSVSTPAPSFSPPSRSVSAPAPSAPAVSAPSRATVTAPSQAAPAPSPAPGRGSSRSN